MIIYPSIDKLLEKVPHVIHLLFWQPSVHMNLKRRFENVIRL